MMIPTKITFGGATRGPGNIFVPQNNRNFWSSQTTVNQLVFDFWGTPSKYMAAIKGHQASLLDTTQTRDNVFLTVSQGYFKTLRAKKMVEVAKQNVFDLKAHLKIAQDQYEFGVVTYNDVLQAKVSLADAEQNLIVAETDYINIRSEFNKVLMLPVTAPTVLKDEKVDLKAWALGEATDVALKQPGRPQGHPGAHPAAGKDGGGDPGPVFPQFCVQAGHTYQVNNYTCTIPSGPSSLP